MPLYFRKNNTTYHYPPYDYGDDYAFDFDDGITSGSGGSNTCLLCYRRGNETIYAPCLKTTNSYMDGQYFRYRWDSSKPSLAVNKNGTTYHLANVRKYIYVRPQGYTRGNITYTRTKQSNWYYKVVFTIPYSVYACTSPIAENNGSWRLKIVNGPSDITYTTSWGGTYSGTLTPNASTTSYTATCTITAIGGSGASTAKSRWFDFYIENSTNGLSYYLGEKEVTESWYEPSYAIPAGTYTPSAFRSLISQYISPNRTRKCANAFTAKVNNQTISVSSGQTIAYKHCGASPWIGTFVDFSGSTSNVNAYSASNSFTGSKAYCVGLSNPSETGGGTGSYNNMFHSFANYSITITTGISFQ